MPDFASWGAADFVRSVPREGAKCTQSMQKAQVLGDLGLPLVAGAGFEPATFGL